jgi:phosphatidylethanolamine N-methyltransferase
VSSADSDSCDILSTPTATEGETATEIELEEIEVEEDHEKILRTSPPLPGLPLTGGLDRARGVSRHDLFNRYFRRDTVVLVGIDVFRSDHRFVTKNTPTHAVCRTNDLMLLLVLFYAIGFAFLPPLSHRGILALHFLHALAWISFRTFGIGLLLRAQSANKFLVRHFLKNYYYPENDGGSGAVQEAFSNWKSLYNMSMCMTYSEPPLFP